MIPHDAAGKHFRHAPRVDGQNAVRYQVFRSVRGCLAFGDGDVRWQDTKSKIKTSLRSSATGKHLLPASWSTGRTQSGAVPPSIHSSKLHRSPFFGPASFFPRATHHGGTPQDAPGATGTGEEQTTPRAKHTEGAAHRRQLGKSTKFSSFVELGRSAGRTPPHQQPPERDRAHGRPPSDPATPASRDNKRPIL